jgi:hypothetical protein
VATLWSVLGYDQIASDVARALSDSADIDVLEGPPGVGKSWLAKDIGGLWEAGGGSTVIAEGDLLRSDVAYYPFGFAMTSLPSGWRAVGPVIAGIARAGETLVGTAGIVTATVEALAQARRTRRRKRTIFLGDAEQQILYELERLAKDKPLLLVADNLHWWDTRSLELLGRLRDPRMCAAFPFLSELRVLAAQTPEPYQSIAHPEAHDALLAPTITHRFELRRIPRERFDQVLQALGAEPTPTREVSDVLYALSGGHLALASRCADRLREGHGESFLSAADPEQFLRKLLSERMRSLGTMGAQAVALLQVAAVLGLTFRREEVTCASGVAEGETSRLLRYCRDEELLELADGLGRFVHYLYRQHFLSIGEHDRTGIHERLANCLRLLRPAEYDLRCLNAIDAERSGEAAALAIQAALAGEREGRPWKELPRAIQDAMQVDGGIAVIAGFTAALDHLNNYRFAECLASLDALPRALAKSLAAEVDYLRAMCLMSTRSEQDRAKGRAILESWAGYEADEPELGIRLMLLLLYGLSHLIDKEPGWRLEGQIRQVLGDRASFDTAAKDALYTLDRSAGGLYQADVALVRNREAAAHFGPQEGQDILRRPVEYYRCLVNLGASMICNARCADAHEVYADLERLVDGYSPGVFPRLDYPRMNRLLADVRLGHVDPAQAEQRQRELAASFGVESDPFYVENAVAGYCALSGRYADALSIYERLDAHLARSRSEPEPEPSMVYLIRSNRCCVRFLSGEREASRSEWQALASLALTIAYPSRQIYIRRHELLAQVFEDGVATSAKEFDQVLLLRHPEEFGPLWDHFGRAFTLPAIEFWREN